MISTQRNLHTQRNRDSLRIICSMNVRRVSRTVLRTLNVEECRKAEDEDKVEQIKTKPPKAKVAAAIVPPTREEELSKQLQYQQHQIDSLVGQVKKLVSAVKATRASSRGANTTDGPEMQPQNSWRGGSRGRGLPRQAHLRTTPQPRARDSQFTQGAGPTIRCWHVGRWGTIEGSAPL